MTLIEAVRSGRPFRREDSSADSWFPPMTKGSRLKLGAAAILADDWEIDGPKVEITASQFWDAVKKTYKKFYGIAGDPFNDIAKELGLEP